MELKSIDELLQKAKTGKIKKAAIAAAQDTHALEAVKTAVEDGLIEPILIGDPKRIKACMDEIGKIPGNPEIVETESDEESAQKAVEMVKAGEADFIMKGKINSSALLRPVVRKDGLNIGNSISHLSVISLPGFHKLFGLTDCAMNIQPTREQKIAIVKNTVEAFRKMGYENPKIAMLCANEEVTEKQPDTVDAKEIQEMCERGELGKCTVCGPISFDIAMDAEAAAYKGFDSPVAGDPDVLVVPNLVCGNVLNKALKQFAHTTACGAVIGAKCPVALTSRTSSVKNKVLSIAFCASMING